MPNYLLARCCWILNEQVLYLHNDFDSLFLPKITLKLVRANFNAGQIH